MRTFVLGDIHGSYKALLDVFKRSQFDYEKDLLIQLGDVVDRFPESAQCVEELLKIKNLIAIRGNHDEGCNEWLNKGLGPQWWRSQGGESTIRSYVDTGLLTEESHRKFFRDQINYYVDDKNRAFVHGGYTDPRGLGYEQYPADYYWDRSLWENVALPGKNSQNIPKMLRHYDEIYIGHTTTMFWNTTDPMKACNVWNLDTGGGLRGHLTIMDIDTKEFWQSDMVEDYYKEVDR